MELLVGHIDAEVIKALKEKKETNYGVSLEGIFLWNKKTK